MVDSVTYTQWIYDKILTYLLVPLIAKTWLNSNLFSCYESVMNTQADIHSYLYWFGELELDKYLHFLPHINFVDFIGQVEFCHRPWHETLLN